MGLYTHIVGGSLKPNSKWLENHITKKIQTQKRFLKTLEEQFKLIRIKLNKNNFRSVNLFFQDESRFRLITKQKRVITAKGIKPIGTYKHSYLYKWLWGSLSPITGESFCMITDGVSKEFFIKYLQDFSQTNPNELKIIIIDNASFHSTKDIELPKNIILIPIPPYCPELNPAEKMWQWMKDKIAMKIYDTIDTLEDKIEELILEAENQIEVI
jgi:transposase